MSKYNFTGLCSIKKLPSTVPIFIHKKHLTKLTSYFYIYVYQLIQNNYFGRSSICTQVTTHKKVKWSIHTIQKASSYTRRNLFQKARCTQVWVSMSGHLISPNPVNIEMWSKQVCQPDPRGHLLIHLHSLCNKCFVPPSLSIMHYDPIKLMYT